MEAISKSAESGTEEVSNKELKPWQKGFELDYLKELEKRFNSYNEYAQHELSKFKKNNIAEALSKDQLHLLGKGLIHKTEVKVKTKINMFPGVVIGEKLPGDIEIKHLGYSDEFDRRNIITTLMEDTYYTNNNVWLLINEESGPDKSIASEAHFEKVGVKYNSVADIIGVYFRNAGQVLEDRQHREVPIYEKYTLKPLQVSFTDITKQLAKQLEGKCSVEGYIKPGTIKIITYSSGLIETSSILFEIVLECQICLPVENMLIKCKALNITKAGIRAVYTNEESPVTIYIARDHHIKNNDFNKIKKNDILSIRVIGIRYQLNDENIHILAEYIKNFGQKKQKLKYNKK